MKKISEMNHPATSCPKSLHGNYECFSSRTSKSNYEISPWENSSPSTALYQAPRSTGFTFLPGG